MVKKKKKAAATLTPHCPNKSSVLTYLSLKNTPSFQIEPYFVDMLCIRRDEKNHYHNLVNMNNSSSFTTIH